MAGVPYRFLTKVEKTEDCWLWKSQRNRQGYGQYTLNYKTLLAHRYHWEVVNGPIPDGLFVLHRCNNPSCVRPEHLYLGTHQDNMKDRELAGTVSRVYGEKNHQAILTQVQADWARKQVEAGMTHRNVAFKLRCSRALISLIIQGKRY